MSLKGHILLGPEEEGNSLAFTDHPDIGISLRKQAWIRKTWLVTEPILSFRF